MTKRKSNKMKNKFSLETVDNDEEQKLRKFKENTKKIKLEKLLNMKQIRLHALQNALSAM